MRGFLLDTHIWLWHLLGSPRLPLALKALIDRSLTSCWLSPISIWEAGYLFKSGKLKIAEDFGPWVETALRRMPLQEASLNFEVARRSQGISLTHRDPADYFLVATALVHGLTLMTIDERLTGHKWLATRSG